MAKNRQKQQTPVKQQPQPNIIVHDLTQVAPDRSRKDVGKLKAALVRAESIHNPNRVQLYDIYHDITTIDAHLAGIIKKRMDAVLNKSLNFVDKNKRKQDALESLIYSNEFNNYIRQIMLSKMWGVSGVQFIVGDKFRFDVIPRKHIRPESRTIAKTPYDATGIPVDDIPYTYLIGEPGDLGELLQCSMYAIYKRSGFGDFAQYVEIFGQPVRVIYYDAHDTRTKEDLHKILKDSGGSLAMMIPRQAQFEMLDGKTSNGTGELQTRLINACNEEMSIALLGNSETTVSSSSSGYAQAEIHSKQQLEITKSDLTFVQNVLNEGWFIEVLKSYGYPVEDGSFEFEMELDLDNLKKRLEIDKEVSSKVPIDDDYWYTTYGIPKPDNYDELKQHQEEERQALIQINNRREPDEENDDTETDVTVTRKEKNLLARMASFFFGGEEVLSLNDFYRGNCGCSHTLQLPELAGGESWSAIYTYIASRLLNEEIATGEIPQNLYEKTAGYLMAAISGGLGGNSFDYGDSRNILKSYLTRNIYHFSAAKTLSEMLEYRNLMYDKKTGEIRPYNVFLQAVKDKGKLFNDVWLKTEYDTALESAIMAHRWDSLDAEYLEFSTVGDNRVRPEHAALDGKTFPKNHSFWNTYYPPLDYNCRCTVVPGIAANYTDGNNYQFAKGIIKNPLFENNVGKTRIIFNNKHPYFVNSYSQVKELTYKRYGMPSEKTIRLRGNLPVHRETSLQEFLTWWDAQPKYEGDNIAVKDVLGQQLLFTSNDNTDKGRRTAFFKGHILRKKGENRELYGTCLKDIVQRPHEVWDDGAQTWYLKYYEQRTITVVVDNKNLVAASMYQTTPVKTEQLRAGILKYRKTKSEK